MSEDKGGSVGDEAMAARGGRRDWVPPQLIRIRASSAEGGANDIIPEGQFGLGS